MDTYLDEMSIEYIEQTAGIKILPGLLGEGGSSFVLPANYLDWEDSITGFLINKFSPIPDFAVKIQKSPFGLDDISLRDFVSREIEFLKKLTHNPDVLQPISSGRTQYTNVDYIVFPHRATLTEKYITWRKKPIGNLLQDMKTYAIQLHGLHVNDGVTHQDISPGNLMIPSQISDFGCAKEIGVVVKVPRINEAYSPPEQFKSGYVATPAQDVWNFAISFYQTALKLTWDETCELNENLRFICNGQSNLGMEFPELSTYLNEISHLVYDNWAGTMESHWLKSALYNVGLYAFKPVEERHIRMDEIADILQAVI
jgi:serine/threonine protein kinase